MREHNVSRPWDVKERWGIFESSWTIHVTSSNKHIEVNLKNSVSFSSQHEPWQSQKIDMNRIILCSGHWRKSCSHINTVWSYCTLPGGAVGASVLQVFNSPHLPWFILPVKTWQNLIINQDISLTVHIDRSYSTQMYFIWMYIPVV